MVYTVRKFKNTIPEIQSRVAAHVNRTCQFIRTRFTEGAES
jgi:hypothetical protein